MKRQLKAILAFALTLGLALSLSLSAVAVAAAPEVIEGEYGGFIVKLRVADEGEAMTLAAAPDCLMPVLPDMGYYLVSTKEDAAALIASGLVEFMEPDYRAELFDLPAETQGDIIELEEASPLAVAPPNDPAYKDNKQNNLNLIGMNYAWENELTGAGVTVAVIDSGYTPLHEDAPAHVLPGKYLYYVKNPEGDESGVKLGNLPGTYTLKVEEDTPERIVTTDDYKNGHGTRLSGIIAAATNNEKGIIGIAPQVKILPVRCFTGTVGHVGAYTSNLSLGIQFAIEQGVDIINMSWGIRANPKMLADVIEDAYDAGIIMVAAVGNDGANEEDNKDAPPDMLIYPATYPQVIGVACTDNTGGVSTISQKNKTALLSAPGEYIYTPDNQTTNQYSGSYRGTSFSSPTVAAALALAKAADPSLTQEECILLLAGTAVPLAEDAENREFGGNGMLNMETLMTRQGTPLSRAVYHVTKEKNADKKVDVVTAVAIEATAFWGDAAVADTRTVLMATYDARGHLVASEAQNIAAEGGLTSAHFTVEEAPPGTTYRVFFLDQTSLKTLLPVATCTVPDPLPPEE